MSKSMKSIVGSIDESLKFIDTANDLREVNEFLTLYMAGQKIQALIKDGGLSVITSRVIALASLEFERQRDEACRLVAAAILGRLSAVARGREAEIGTRIPELFTSKPASLDVLADGDEKYYAAAALQNVKSNWVLAYCFDQSLQMDAAEKARRVLLEKALSASGSLSKFWSGYAIHLASLGDIGSDDARYKRIRRVTSSVAEVIRGWGGEVGDGVGDALSEWVSVLMRTPKKDADAAVIADVVDDVMTMLLRIVELRFSNALMAKTYGAVECARRSCGNALWADIQRSSKNIENVRTCLKEAALVLARQGRTDRTLLDAMRSVYHSRSQLAPALSAHFSQASELDQAVRRWWESVGMVGEGERKVEHRIGNSEDHQIGALLINIEESKTVIEKLERAVVPFLEISDPPLAETVKKAAAGFSEIAMATRQLAAMRKLSHMDLKGETVEYSPLQHDMLGGHEMGIRVVKVVRDGIKKDFGGKVKILVKPRVIPQD